MFVYGFVERYAKGIARWDETGSDDAKWLAWETRIVGASASRDGVSGSQLHHYPPTGHLGNITEHPHVTCCALVAAGVMEHGLVGFCIWRLEMSLAHSQQAMMAGKGITSAVRRSRSAYPTAPHAPNTNYSIQRHDTSSQDL